MLLSEQSKEILKSTLSELERDKVNFEKNLEKAEGRTRYYYNELDKINLKIIGIKKDLGEI